MPEINNPTASTTVHEEEEDCYDYKEDIADIDRHWREGKLRPFPQRRHAETHLISHKELEYRKANPILLKEIVIEPHKQFRHHQTDPVEARPTERLE